MMTEATKMVAGATSRFNDPWPPQTRLHFETVVKISEYLALAMSAIDNQELAGNITKIRDRARFKADQMREMEAKQMKKDREL
jgi:hypothetical protein